MAVSYNKLWKHSEIFKNILQTSSKKSSARNILQTNSKKSSKVFNRLTARNHQKYSTN